MKTHTLVQDDQREGLTKEEKDECDMLLGEGFKEWNKKDFSVFKSACERHGRSAFEAVAQELEGKDAEEVERYSDAFWKLGPSPPPLESCGAVTPEPLNCNP